ncbi:ABC transporter substrate-binding protein [Paenarthrobacter ureafaciens]|uniref:ABC transporter substrate-binding protein n=1 Tax=Paenarthrobacter ureafaciens TaxID=37931 RepID=UPI0015C09BBA|nr:ABC transporter substrate-binding protein [Paenarthrobacter ureafaciens]
MPSTVPSACWRSGSFTGPEQRTELKKSSKAGKPQKRYQDMKTRFQRTPLRRKARTLGVAMLIASAMTALAACSSGSGVQESKAKEKITIFLAAPVNAPSFYPVLMPKAMGFYEDLGLDVTILNVDGSPAGIQQLLAGRGDALFGAASAILAGFADGKPIEAVYEPSTQELLTVLVPEESPIKKLEDLKGALVGVRGPGAGEIAQHAAVLNSVGLTLGEDVKYVPVGSDVKVINQQLASGTISAYLGVSVAAAESKIYLPAGTLREIPLPTSNGAAKPNSPIIFSKKMVKEKPQAVEAFLKAVVKGTIYANANPEGAAEALAKMAPELAKDRAKFNQYVTNVLPVAAPPAGRSISSWDFGSMSEEGWQALMDESVSQSKFSGFAQPFSLEGYVNTSFIDKANDFDKEAFAREAKSLKAR